MFVRAFPDVYGIVWYLRYEPLGKMENRILKRLFDVVFSGLFLVTVFPFVYLIVGSIIKLTSPGPVFFKQMRTGLNGVDFLCYKFRSMKVNDEANSKLRLMIPVKLVLETFSVVLILTNFLSLSMSLRVICR